MFTRKDQLLRKTGPDGVGRYDFLRLLKKEYQETKSQDARRQTLANLANFSYDPINFDFMRDLKIIDLFLEVLQSEEEDLVRYAIAGICNLSSDPQNKTIIIRERGIPEILNLLSLNNEEILLDSILTLILLKSDDTSGVLTQPAVAEKVRKLIGNGGPRLKNLVTLFLENGDFNPAKN